MGYRIGADIGGTFTDIALVDAAGERLEIVKVATTPERPDDAVIAGIRTVLEASDVAPDAVAHVVHGTTLFTNALIERKGARTALVTTAGFRDAVEIGREHRYDMYDLHLERPEPLAPRSRRYEVAERILADGSVFAPLDEAGARALAERLVAEGIEAVAVCFLHAYANPAHERAMGQVLAEMAPGLAVSLSSDIAPEIREYDRASTTLVNVYVKRIAERYLGRLAERLRAELAIPGPLYVMQSNGGLAAVDTAASQPVRLIESGPAAGALAAAHFAARHGIADLLSVDMGGTTAKACVIADGAPLIAPEFEVDRRYRFKKGSGLPVKTPVIELIEIGTGGGSIARVDTLGRLAVGPESAGAAPGPAAYGQGGTEATVTDADLVLGYLDPGFFLGGSMRLDRAAAEAALLAGPGASLGLDALSAARAVHSMANEAMASAARLHAVERGKEASRLSLFAFGGAGPVHAWGIARILRAPAVIYPFGAGVMSAIGFLAAPAGVDLVRSAPAPLDATDWPGVARAVAEMAEAGRAALAASVPAEALTTRLVADMRYTRQGHEIRVPVPLADTGPGNRAEREIGPALAAPLAAAFAETYGALYGHTVPDAAVEVVSWRAILEGPRPTLALRPPAPGAGAAALKGHREAWLPGTGMAEGRLAPVPVYDRYALAPGTALEGPAIIEERESTVVITDPARIRVDETGNLIAERAP
ncbi:MAG: hydantoinase/oxoprolinase family protein [Pseudomonadota bacterium]